MDDWHDIAQDEFIGELYSDFARDVLAGRDELYGEVVNQFTSERLQSFYVDNPKIAEPALWALSEARALLADHVAAALVMGVVATEVGLKATLLKPILHGLIHEESLAGFVVELVPDQRNDKFRDLLFAILSEYGGIDLRTFKRAGLAQTLWEEIVNVQKVRNALIHRAEQVATQDAQKAIDIASAVVNDLFPGVIAKLGLHTHGQLEVCGRKH